MSPQGKNEPPTPTPSVHEHGENGYTDNAVGGFGVGYDAQVAHGAAGESIGARSDSEFDSNPAMSVTASLEHAVRKTLARAHIDAADLHVQAVGTEIHLRGTVHHAFEKAELETRARSVPGVSAVVSEIGVLRAGFQENS